MTGQQTLDHAATPRHRTPVIGREQELASVLELIVRDDVPLLSLTGPGGVGKTRLALLAASRLQRVFRDGVRYVSLGPVLHPDRVMSTIRRTLGVPEAKGRSDLEQLAMALHQRELLLLLDNFEHVLPAAPLVVDLLQLCTNVTILTTSRERLRVSGEREFPVQPLALPDRGTAAPYDTVAGSAAVQLFAARAEAVQPGFAVTEENSAEVAEICRRLDGLPLAIELAAARAKVMAPSAILGRLERRLPLLIGGNRDAPARHQTMRAAIAWSYALLDPDEKVFFCRLAVFISGFSLEAAECLGHVAGSEVEAFTLLSSLVDKNLIRTVVGASSPPRYEMLQTIREFALERLVSEGDEKIARRAHADWYLGLAERFAAASLDPGINQWLDRLEEEHADFLSAIDWLLACGESDLAIQMAGAIWQFWHFRAHLLEGRQVLERVLAVGGTQTGMFRPRALHAAAMLAWDRGELNQARTLAEEALRLSAGEGQEFGTALSHHILGMVALGQGELVEAVTRLEAAKARYQKVPRGRAFSLANVLTGLGLVAFLCGDLEQASTHYNEALVIARAADHRLMTGIVLSQMGRLAHQQAEHAAAADLFRESLALLAESRVHWMCAASLDGLAVLAAEHGDFARAARLCGAVESWCELVAAAPSPTAYSERERAMAVARSRIGEQVVAEAWAAGRRLSLEEATVEALSAPTVGGQVDDRAVTFGLSPRERQVMGLIAAGHTNAEIASMLYISPRTASTHASHILGKLGLGSRSELIAFAHRSGLV